MRVGEIPNRADDFPCRIFCLGKGLFLVPREKDLPHLKWIPEEQRFVVLIRDGDDLVLCLSPRETVSLDSLHKSDIGDDVDKVIDCCAIYGVLPIGRTSSILVYVTLREHVTTLPFAGSHDIFAVRQLKCMLLASCPVGAGCSDVPKNEEKDFKESDIQPEMLQGLSGDIVSEYFAVVERFCSNSSEHYGGSYFFYSPTVNLALDPSEMVNKRNDSPITTVSGCVNGPSIAEMGNGSGIEENLSTIGVFQWNAPLLKAFDKPGGSTHGDTTYYFTPSFIRGMVTSCSDPIDGVQLLLINRLSYRWSGTRYNRRGLDSSGTGVPANFSVSTLWVFPTERRHESNGMTASLAKEKRVATFSVLRGSVPRRWSQPANLRVMPKITVLSSTSGVGEFLSHLQFLQVLFGGISSLYCIDTTSESELECPLSNAFRDSWSEYENGTEKGRFMEVVYQKYNVKAKMKKLSYDEMQMEILRLFGGGDDGDSGVLDFSQWSADSVVADEVMSDVGEDYLLEWKQKHQQGHYARINCLDCLDRTNLVQSMIAIGVLPPMIRYVRGIENNSVVGNGNDDRGSEDYVNGEFNKSKMQCKKLWVQQGIALSQLYAGSDPHFVSYLLGGHSGFRDMCGEGILALQRWVQQNLYDGDKQDAISLITRQHNPAFFHSEFESPFSRRLSGLNKMVVLGFFVALIPLVLNIFLAFLYPAYRWRHELLLVDVLWCIYLFLWISHIKKKGVDYTNYPLLQ